MAKEVNNTKPIKKDVGLPIMPNQPVTEPQPKSSKEN